MVTLRDEKKREKLISYAALIQVRHRLTLREWAEQHGWEPSTVHRVIQRTFKKGKKPGWGVLSKAIYDELLKLTPDTEAESCKTTTPQ